MNGERASLLGWGRAVLLQFAHPLVAQGVADHTEFQGGSAERLGRLARTVDAMLAFTFGPPEAAERAAAAINRIHDRVHGHLPEAVGCFPRGTPYSARDPHLLGWVHATVVESTLLVYERAVEPLTTEERDRYWEEAAAAAPLLGIPPDEPPRTAAEARSYIDEMMASGEIAVGGTARRLALDLLWPGWTLDRPAQWIVRLFTVGLLPPPVREAYGFSWGPARERALGIATSGLRAGLPLLPDGVRRWSPAEGRAAEGRAADAPPGPRGAERAGDGSRPGSERSRRGGGSPRPGSRP